MIVVIPKRVYSKFTPAQLSRTARAEAIAQVCEAYLRSGRRYVRMFNQETLCGRDVQKIMVTLDKGLVARLRRLGHPGRVVAEALYWDINRELARGVSWK